MAKQIIFGEEARRSLKSGKRGKVLNRRQLSTPSVIIPRVIKLI